MLNSTTDGEWFLLRMPIKEPMASSTLVWNPQVLEWIDSLKVMELDLFRIVGNLKMAYIVVFNIDAPSASALSFSLYAWNSPISLLLKYYFLFVVLRGFFYFPDNFFFFIFRCLDHKTQTYPESLGLLLEKYFFITS